MHNILVTSIGSASAESVISQLKKEKNRIIGTNIFDEKHTYCSMIVDAFYKVSRSDSEKFIKEVLDICWREKIKYIIPLTDLEVDSFNRHRDLLKRNGLIVCYSDYDCILTCRNKYLSSVLVNSLNVCNVPKTIKVFDENIHSFPVICKKIHGRSSEGVKVLRSLDDFNKFRANLSDDYIIQEYIEGNVVTVDLLRYEDQVLSVSREEIVRTVNGLGISVCTFKDDNLDDIVRVIADSLNVYGCVNFEFIKTDTGYYFIECNPRFSGGINFSLLSGYDFILNHFHCFSNEGVDGSCNTIEHVINRKYTDIIYSGDDNYEHN